MLGASLLEKTPLLFHNAEKQKLNRNLDTGNTKVQPSVKLRIYVVCGQ